LEGTLDYTWPAQVDRRISRDGFDLILSIGQVIPHQAIRMANYTKNILIRRCGRDGGKPECSACVRSAAHRSVTSAPVIFVIGSPCAGSICTCSSVTLA
jgi:hypothetical protein